MGADENLLFRLGLDELELERVNLLDVRGEGDDGRLDLRRLGVSAAGGEDEGDEAERDAGHGLLLAAVQLVCVATQHQRGASSRRSAVVALSLRKLPPRATFATRSSFCGLQSRHPARWCFGRRRLWWLTWGPLPV